MNRCEKCIHYDACNDKVFGGGIARYNGTTCEHFKSKDLMIELPCKVGTPVFIINKTMGRVYPGKFRLDDIDQFGRRVFLTRADAEKAVKGA